MAFSSGFFDAKDRDRVYTAENFTEYLSSLICNGILDTYGDCFAVTANNDLSVTVGTGKAWLDGHYFTNDSSYTVDLSPHVSAAGSQYVTIGICCDTNGNVRECSLIVEAGAAIHNFTNTDSQTYLTLAAVYLPAGTSSIISADITDFREDESKCGYVKCILGKCGFTDLLARMDALEKRADTLDGMMHTGDPNLPLIAFSQAATGMVSSVGDFVSPVEGLMGIVGSLEGLKIKKEDEE